MRKSFALKSIFPVSIQAFLYRLNALFSMLSFRKMSRSQGKDLFFVVGCGRSGNTLLRSMLVAGGDVCIPPESYVLPRAIALYKAYGFLPWPQLASLIISEFESYADFFTWDTDLAGVHARARQLSPGERTFEDVLKLVYEAYREQHFPLARLVGDKTPINTIFAKRIYGVFPKAKYIHILRNPKACVASYIKSGMQGLDEAVDFWQTSTRNCLLLERSLPAENFIRVEYESLVTEPEQNLRRICGFLDVDYSQNMLEFWKKSGDLGDVGAHDHHKNTRNPLSSKSIDAWKVELSSREIEVIEKKTSSLYASLSRVN
jgi:protein-tyrosine sulfotransferase